MAVLAVITSSVLFSLYHYVGPEAFRWDTFAFRTLAGMMLAGIFVTRGFGIAVGSHACYNIFLLMA
jgi:membrane protease YdiL (CAAX protease family)